MCFVQETRRDFVSVSYVHWVTRVSRALVHCLLLGGGSSQTVTKRSQTMPNDAETKFRKRTEPTNKTGHVEFSDSHSVWSRDNQQAKQA